MSEWVVLAGGLGTRSADPRLPKILQSIGKGTVLDFLLFSLRQANAKRVHFVLRHESRQVEEYLDARSKHIDFHWDVLIDDGNGPVAALQFAESALVEAEVGVVFGDTLISAPLNKFKSEFGDSGLSAGIVVRQSDHPGDSDVFTIDDLASTLRFYPKGVEPEGNTGLVWCATGILFIRKSFINTLDQDLPDLTRAIVSAVGESNIRLMKSSYYHRDTGTPQRLAQCSADAELGVLFRKGNDGHAPRRAVFFDRDGTLFPDVPEGRADFKPNELFVQTVQLLTALRTSGFPIFMVTNQPQCAKGFIKIGDVYRLHNQLQGVLAKDNAFFDDIRFCPHHPSHGFPGEVESLKIICKCRKPSTGMLDELALDHSIDLRTSLFIGDTDVDNQIASNSGMKFLDINVLSSMGSVERLQNLISRLGEK